MRESIQSHSYIAAIGGANMDINTMTPVPLASADSTPGHIRCAPGGVARNVAENLARLGHSVKMVSVVGDDLFGKSLVESTRAAGVCVDAIGCLPGQHTATYLSVHRPDGEMSFAINDMAIVECLTPEYLVPHADCLSKAACLVLDCNLPIQTLEWLFSQRWDVPIFVDAVSVSKCIKIAPWLGSIHTLKVNRLEAQVLSACAVTAHQDALHAAQQLQILGARNVVISLGEQGVCWRDVQGHAGCNPVGVVEVVNTSGAGDALLAGLVHGHCDGLALQQSVAWAMACAEINVTSAFANAPDLSVVRVEQRLSARMLSI
jgi:pseudouridine kinase